MKKIILLYFASIPAFLFAQTQQVKEIPLSTPQHAEPVNKAWIGTDHSNLERTPGKVTALPLYKKAKPYDYVNIGETYYDLQANASTGRRIVLHADGTVSAVWTTSPDDATNFPNRGTGYNYFDGNDWMTPVTSRLEASARTGWPSIGILSTGEEYIIGHDATTGGFHMSVNTGVGSTSWTTMPKALDDETVPGVNRSPIWNRSAAGNGYIHLICNYTFDEDAGTPRVVRDGVENPTTYSRYNETTEEWEIQHTLLPGYDSTIYISGSSDNYAIDVKDSIVAIVIGGLGDPISLWKSTDNGNTFSYTDVDSIPDLYKGNPQLMRDLFITGDTIQTNDGTVDVILDADNKAHIFFGSTILFAGFDANGDSGTFFRPGIARLMHWTEGDAAPKLCGGTIDMDGNGVLDINPETINILNNQNVPNNLLSAARTGNTCLVTMPSSSIDADGNIYVVYSAAIEHATHFLNANYRDILVSYSTDGGATWLGPQNITQDRFMENNFPSAAKMADDFVHLIWQMDETPGTFLQNHSPTAGTHPNILNRIMYAAVPTSAILNNEIGQNTLSTQDVHKSAQVFVVSQNYPNPFENEAKVTIYMMHGSELNLTITDILGNVVSKGDIGYMNAGNHVINIDASTLSSGMYFYTLSSKDHSITRKMQVK